MIGKIVLLLGQFFNLLRGGLPKTHAAVIKLVTAFLKDGKNHQFQQLAMYNRFDL